MSEQNSDKPFCSDESLGAKRKPTVIRQDEGGVLNPPVSASQKPKPTVIVNNPVKPQPTVIGGGETNARPIVVKPTPTVIAPAPVKPEGSMAIKNPSIIPGTVRKGFDVSTSDLGKVYPGASSEILTKVEMILKSTIVETLNTIACSQWGSKTQARYTELVSESLRLTSAQVVQDSIRHNIRLYELLEEIAVSFQFKNSKVFQFWKKVQTPWEKLQSVRNELTQLREKLSRALPELRNTQSSLNDISLEFQKLVAELDAFSVSANYIADHLGSGDSRSAHLLDQSVSLTKMIAHIQEGVILRTATVQEIDSIADRIQESVLSTLPAWIEKASLVLQRSSTNETERYVLRQGLEEIIQNIK